MVAVPQWPLRENIVIIIVWLVAPCLAVLQEASVSLNSKMNHALCLGGTWWLGFALGRGVGRLS